jgi:hypothetical protein
MRYRHRLSLLLLTSTISASLAAAACGDYKSSPLSPGGIGSASTFILAVEPTQLFRRPVVGTTCASGQAFLVPFHLQLRSDSSSALSLHQVRFQFTDSSGLPAPSIAMQQGDLLSHFGTVGIPPLGSRTFPFSVPLGCSTRPVGNLSIFVETIDRAGGFAGRTMRLPIR